MIKQNDLIYMVLKLSGMPREMDSTVSVCTTDEGEKKLQLYTLPAIKVDTARSFVNSVRLVSSADEAF